MSSIAAKHDMAFSILQRASKIEAKDEAILSMSQGYGQKQRIDQREECIILYACLYFANNGTRLDKSCILDLTHV